MLRVQKRDRSGSSNTFDQVQQPVLTILKEYASLDMALIEAQQLFDEQDFGACYTVLKSIRDKDAFFLDTVPLLCSVLIELGK